MKPLFLTTAAMTLALATTAHADIVLNDDVIINNPSNDRLCVGNSCVNGESWGNENVKISDTTPDLLFDDTTTNSHDWFIDINNGDAYYFRITELPDTGGNRFPFEIEGGAPNYSLFVESTGDIGLGTSMPARNLHIVDTSTSYIRLEDAGGSPGIWDFFANDGNMGIYDISNGTIPFRILDGAPNNSFYMRDSGNIGMGTFSPDGPLHVWRNDGTAGLIVEDNAGTVAARELFRMVNNGGSYFTLMNTATGNDWYFTHENNVQGRFIITSSVNPSQGLFLENDGDMTIGGVLTQNSDKHAKMAIEPVDPAEVLEKVTSLPVAAWTYKDDTAGARHMGPMAQDFHALFGLGATETGISTIDTSGVALAAIQALAAENAALKRELEAQTERHATLADRIAALEAAD